MSITLTCDNCGAYIIANHVLDVGCVRCRLGAMRDALADSPKIGRPVRWLPDREPMVFKVELPTGWLAATNWLSPVERMVREIRENDVARRRRGLN